jgi:hypothetical protein
MANMENKITEILEGQGLTQEQIAEILYEISQTDMGPMDPTLPRPQTMDKIERIETELRSRMNEETDWKKKAAMAAKLISLGISDS